MRTAKLLEDLVLASKSLVRHVEKPRAFTPLIARTTQAGASAQAEKRTGQAINNGLAKTRVRKDHGGLVGHSESRHRSHTAGATTEASGAAMRAWWKWSHGTEARREHGITMDGLEKRDR